MEQLELSDIRWRPASDSISQHIPAGMRRGVILGYLDYRCLAQAYPNGNVILISESELICEIFRDGERFDFWAFI